MRSAATMSSVFAVALSLSPDLLATIHVGSIESLLAFIHDREKAQQSSPSMWRVTRADEGAVEQAHSEQIAWQAQGNRLRVGQTLRQDLMMSEWNGSVWISSTSSGDALVLEALLNRIPLLDTAAFVEGVRLPSYFGTSALTSVLGRAMWDEVSVAADGTSRMTLSLGAGGVRWVHATSPRRTEHSPVFSNVEVLWCASPQPIPPKDHSGTIATFNYLVTETDCEGRPVKFDRKTTALLPNGTRRPQVHHFTRMIDEDPRWKIALTYIAAPRQGTRIIDGGLGIVTNIGSSTVEVLGSTFETSSPIRDLSDARAAIWLVGIEEEHPGEANGREDRAIATDLPQRVQFDDPAITCGELGAPGIGIRMNPIHFHGSEVVVRHLVTLHNCTHTARRVINAVATCGCLQPIVRQHHVPPGGALDLEIQVRFAQPAHRRERITLVFDDGSMQELKVEAVAAARLLLRASPRAFDAQGVPELEATLVCASTSRSPPPPPSWEPAVDHGGDENMRFDGWQLLRPAKGAPLASDQYVWRGRLHVLSSAFRSHGTRAIRVGDQVLQFRGDGMPWR